MKVVGVDKIEIFCNFICQKSTVIFTGYRHLRRLFFSDFDMSKKSKITKICVMFVTSTGVSCGKLSIAGLRSKTKKSRTTQQAPRLK
jgi:hypothetical protein